MTALAGANLTAFSGEVHALLGENGAGKSTLVHVLGGLAEPDDGSIHIRGQEVRLASPASAANASIGLVHQHFKLVPALTALENVALSVVRRGWRLPMEEVRARAKQVADAAGLAVDLDARVDQMGVGAKQRIEVIKLLYSGPEILVLDEPTAVLAPTEVAALFKMIRELAGMGKTVLLVAHKLDEVLSIADRITVLRRGRTVLEAPRDQVDASALTRAMVGDANIEVPARVTSEPGPVVVSLRGVSHVGANGGEALRNVDLEIRRGEIVGIAGVEGNGQRPLSLVLTGRDEPKTGVASIPRYVGFVPQDRGHEGLASQFSLVENTALAAHSEAGFRRGPFLDWSAIRTRTREIVERFDVRSSGVDLPSFTLSGGNQQKLVVGRETARARDLLVVENPTRGLDVAAAAFVHRVILDLRTQGAEAPGVVLVSTDLDEVLALSDRIFAAVRGELVPVEGNPPTRDAVGAAMLSSGT